MLGAWRSKPHSAQVPPLTRLPPALDPMAPLNEPHSLVLQRDPACSPSLQACAIASGGLALIGKSSTSLMPKVGRQLVTGDPVDLLGLVLVPTRPTPSRSSAVPSRTTLPMRAATGVTRNVWFSPQRVYLAGHHRAACYDQ